MALPPHELPRVLVDSDVLYAAAASASEYGASLLILRLAELTFIRAIAPEQVIVEVTRNLQAKLPRAVNTLRTLVDRSLQVTANPDTALVQQYQGKAHSKDLSILVSAVENECRWLVTFNMKDYQPGLPTVKVLKPGDFVILVRQQLAVLISYE